MLIYICCSGGATSSELCRKTAEASKMNAKVGYVYDLIKDMNTSLLEYDAVFTCGPVDIMRKENLRESGLVDKLSYVLICPQMRFMAPSVKEYCDTLNIPVGVVDMKTFAAMDGEKIWSDIKESLGI